ncbi:MAG TPA: SRPBCC family protein, partial [Gaiellales bacterium]|nr:SRPBCC family protein [Gaiellales bacterium]
STMPIPDQTVIEPVRKSVVVRRPQAEVFELFTDRLGTWWPLAVHSIAADTFENRVTAEAIIFEKHAGGRVLERMSDGTEAPWGTILAWEPPARFVMSWKPTLDQGPSTELELRFTSLTGGRTRIDLEHRGWELLGPGDPRRAGYDEGWGQLFARFAGVAETA